MLSTNAATTAAEISTSQAAKLLGCSLEWVYKLLYAGRLDAVKIDGKWHISRSAVERRNELCSAWRAAAAQ